MDQPISIHLFGAPVVKINGTPIKLPTAKALALAAYLAATQKPHRREALAALLWPEHDRDRAYATLRTTLWKIKRSHSIDWIEADRDLIQLKSELQPWVDVEKFREIALWSARTKQAFVRGTFLDKLKEAVDMYHADFMVGFTLKDCPEYDIWQMTQNNELKQHFVCMLERLVDVLGEMGSHEEARQYALRLLNLDPLDESRHRLIMKIDMLLGRRSAAMHQYFECSALIQAEYQSPPQQETVSLFQMIERCEVHNNSYRYWQTGAQVYPLFSGSQIPIQPTPFVGRTKEVKTLNSWIIDPKRSLISLVGPGGVGKTRLALRAVSEVAVHFRHGACFVPLAPVSEPQFLISAIAVAINLPLFDQGNEKLQLINYLREKEMLLLLDNFEHLLPASELLVEILRSASGVKLLVTSRERLHLRGEWVFPLEGMDYPVGPLENMPIERFSSVRLFLQTAQRIQPNYALTVEDRQAVAQLCRILQGLPLAIELAAGSILALSPAEIVHEIKHGLDVLESSFQDLPNRHRSIRAVFDYSWSLLSAGEKIVLSRLSVFRGAFSRQAAEQVGQTESRTLSALIDKSMLRRHSDGSFELLEVLRNYLAEKLAAAPVDEKEARDRLARYYAAYMDQQLKGLLGPEQKQVLKQIGQVIEDVRIAWKWCVERNLKTECWQMGECLGRVYMIRGSFKEGEKMFEEAFLAFKDYKAIQGHEQQEHIRLLIRLIIWLVFFQRRMRHLEQAQCGAVLLGYLSRRSGDLVGLARAFQSLGSIAAARGEIEKARYFQERSLQIHQQLGDRRAIAISQIYLGNIAATHEQAKQYYEASLEILTELGELWAISSTLINISSLAYKMGLYEEAKRLSQKSIDISRSIDDPSNLDFSLSNYGTACAALGEYAEAKRCYLASLNIAREIGNHGDIGECYQKLGAVSRAMGNREEAGGYLLNGLQTLAEPSSITVMLNLLVECARYEGDVKPERAIPVLAAVLSHPSAWDDTRVAAQSLLGELQARVQAEFSGLQPAPESFDEVISEVHSWFQPWQIYQIQEPENKH